MVLLTFDLGVVCQDGPVILDTCPTDNLVIVTITPSVEPITITGLFIASTYTTTVIIA